VQNGCPGEAVTPAEIFLAGVAACGVELLQFVARQEQIPLRAARVSVRGVLDRGKPVRPDVSVFNAVHLAFTLEGVDEAQATTLVSTFKRR
jgi:organic hydroperoxide reductase OsmC/OhrA